MKIVEQHIRLQYRLLRHTGFKTLVHCQDMLKQTVVDRRLVSNEEELVGWCKTFTGRGNLFVGGNPRNDDKGCSLAAIGSFTIDIDPARPKGSAATTAQVADAVRVGRTICRRYPGGLLCLSGNGVQIIYTWPPFSPDSKETFRRKCAAFTKALQAEHKNDGSVVIDSIHDPERLIKIVGSLSVKGDKALWRVSKFLDLDVIKDATWMLAHINATDLREAIATVPLKASGEVDRSKADYALAVKCKMQGFTAQQTYECLIQHAFKPGRPDDAKRLIDKLYGDEAEQDETRSDTVGMAEGLDEYKRRLAERSGRTRPELSTGFKELDELTWGFKRGSLFTVAARTGIGKTTLVLSSALALCKAGKRVLFFSTEMDFTELYDRFAAATTGASAFGLSFKGATPENEKALQAFYGEFKGYDLHICDSFEPRIDKVAKIVGEIRPDVFFFDHIQHIGGSTEKRWLEIGAFVRGAKQLARSTNSAGVLVSQLNRSAEYGETSLVHLAECGSIEQESGVVILMNTPSGVSPQAEMSPTAIKIAKNRFGPKGTTQLLFNKPLTRFESLGG